MDLSRAAWHKSKHSGMQGCVEVAFIGGRVAVRDSKDKTGPVLLFSGSEWAAFVSGIQDGQFQPPDTRRAT